MTQNIVLHPSTTPGTTHTAGRPHGADTQAVLTGLGLTPAQLTTLREEGAV